MPKMKSVSGAAKRFKRNGAGSYKRKRQLGEKLEVHANDVQLVRRMLPYS